MTECEDRKCQQALNEVHQEVFGVEGTDGLKQTLKAVKDNQESRTLIINSKMPKSWLWTIIILVAPVTGIALTILISQATRIKIILINKNFTGCPVCYAIRIK